MIDGLIKLSTGAFLVPPGMAVPPCPEGYEILKGKSTVFGKILPPCSFRDKIVKKSSCCGVSERIYCNRKDTFVFRTICLQCEYAKESC